MDRSASLDSLVAEVLASPKYRNVSAEVVRRIGGRELAMRKSLKEAVKATHNKLHQVGGVYFEKRPGYAADLALLAQAAGEPEALREACRVILRQHASTRERLPILDHFFAESLAGLGPIRSVIDLGCGLNPLAIPWMPLADGARYLALDMYSDLIDFLGGAFPLLNCAGRAETCDILGSPAGSLPDELADLALMLKIIPCLEQVDKSAGARLLEGVHARHVLVSFPIRSLSGYHKGMGRTYEDHFLTLVDGRPWRVQRFEFANELAFLVSKGDADARPG
jgi:16S rRNA (guanine(1405)-N(7))-methyltransferase